MEENQTEYSKGFDHGVDFMIHEIRKVAIAQLDDDTYMILSRLLKQLDKKSETPK